MKTRFQKHCLVLSIVCLVICIVLVCIACGENNSPTQYFNRVNEDGLSGRALCPEKAVVACIIMAEQYGWDNVRIMYGPTDEPWAHVQAEVNINGEWLPVATGEFPVTVGKRDNFSPTTEYSVDQVWDNVRQGIW